MFPKSKYNKSNKGPLIHKSNLGVSLQSSKYYPNIYSKKKTGLNKKINNNKFSQHHTWKKQNSYNNWNKENDKNYLNYEQYNSKDDANQYYNNQKEKKNNNKSYYKKEYSHLYSYENEECSFNSKVGQENEKKNSIDYATTQSNSSSHEESNSNNHYNSNDNIKNNNNNFNSNDSHNLNLLEENINIQNTKHNNNNNITDLQILNLNTNSSNIENGPNINVNITSNIIINSNSFIIPKNISFQVPISDIPTSPKTQIKKNKKPKKTKKLCLSSEELDIKKGISANIGNIENDFQLNNEPYNKFNSVGGELITPIINPIVENTEILQVNVKVSKDKSVIFKLRRFDDLFLTVKLFCEINNIQEKLMKPIITKALCTLNSIYQIYNTQLDEKNIKILQMLKNFDNETSI